MGTYNNTYLSNTPWGGQVAVLFQKTDWQQSDVSTSNIYYIGANGLISTNETVNPPIPAWSYSQLQLIVNWGAVTGGTSPNIQFGVYIYDDPNGLKNFGQLTSGFQNTNFAVGASASITTGMPTTTTTSDVTRPAFVRPYFFTSGTWGVLGAVNRLTLIGIK